MPEDPPKQDPRTLVDRLIDRFKNNRFAAALIIAAIGIGGLASLADSGRKLWDLLPSTSTAPLAGEWKSDLAEFYPDVGPEYMRLTLQEAASGQILGRVQFGGTTRTLPRELDIVEAKLTGTKLALAFESGAVKDAAGQATPNRRTITGELRGQVLNLVFQREGHGGVPFTASRVPSAGQRFDARVGITYRGKAYPDHVAACKQLLSDLSPPQVYKNSEPPDEYGNVHCMGLQGNGSPGFDMFQNDVQQALICPPDSRITIRRKAQIDSAMGCECDGTLKVSGGRCVAATQ